ncbi:MAG: nucleoside-diphosphate kinase [Verrucomicrobiota bacterium]
MSASTPPSASGELSCVVLNPSALAKARTGGVLTRLLTRTALDLAGAMVFAPSPEFARELAELLSRDSLAGDTDPRLSMLVHDYVTKNYSPRQDGLRQRCLLLLFQGPDAIAKIKEAVGDYETPSIRRTYGDFVRDDSGKVIYFEPAVFCPENSRSATRLLALFARGAEQRQADPVAKAVPRSESEAADYQRSVVIIKPDNFDFPCGRPGSIINIFSRTDLRITAAKVDYLRVAQMEEFYADVRTKMVEALGETAGARRFDSLIEFMTGRKPGQCRTPEERNAPGTVKVMILRYEGKDAIAKMREVLGPTDPAKAPPGTIRREFGVSMMINGAHASDSPAAAEREMRILEIEQNPLAAVIRQSICF